MHRGHETAHANTIVMRTADFLGLVEHGVELSYLVTVADSLEQLLNAGSVTWHLEIRLLDAQLGESIREQKVHRFWLVTIVGVVRH